MPSSANYISNPSPYWIVNVGYNYNCQLVTLVFLAQGLILSSLAFIISQSHPFKIKVFKNLVLIILTIINFSAFTAYFFIIKDSEIGFLDLQKIALYDAGI